MDDQRPMSSQTIIRCTRGKRNNVANDNSLFSRKKIIEGQVNLRTIIRCTKRKRNNFANNNLLYARE